MSERKQILTASICGCYHCLKTFPPQAIVEWIDVDEKTNVGQTPLCPYCRIDSVIGFPEGYLSVQEHLAQRNKSGFGSG